MEAPARLAVVSPHCDDAVFGCSALIAAHPGAVVVTCFAGAPPAGAPLTEWDRAAGFRPGDDVMGRRREEDRAALAHTGARPAWLDFPDAQYGGSPALDTLAAALERALDAAAPDVVAIPLGLFHSDHVLAHEAALRVRARRGGWTWLAYADALYRRLPRLLAARLAALGRAGIDPVPFAPRAAGDADRKARAVRCYASQLRALATPGRPGIADTLAPETYVRLDG